MLLFNVQPISKITQKSNFDPMHTLREFRKKAKLGQLAMAELLQTSRGLVSMAELGKRSLPEASLVRLKMFQSISVQFNDLPISANPSMTVSKEQVEREWKQAWKKMFDRNQFSLYSTEKRLTALKIKYQGHLSTYEAFFRAVVTISATGGNPAELDYFSNELKKTERKILTCGKIAQLRLQLSIDLLMAEASLLNQYLGSATAEPEVPVKD